MELSGDNIAMPLRMIEIYTDPKTYSDAAVDVVYTVMQHLVRHGECHPVALQYE